MLRSWKLGRAFGIDLYIHWTFFLLPLYMMTVVRWGMQRSWPTALFAMSGILALFACVLLHELGHALMARRFGIGTSDITLYPIGGVARLERLSEKAWEEFWIAVAGPAVNVVIATILGLFFALADVGFSAHRLVQVLELRSGLFDFPLLQQFAIWVMAGNISLVVFNMIPAFPLDGGRVLRALLTPVLGHLRATEFAAALGMVLGGLLALLGLTSTNPMLVLVAGFAVLAGQQELAMVRYKAAHGGVWPPHDEAHATLAIDAAAVPAEPNFSGFTWDRRAQAWIEWRNGRPIQACFVE